VGGGVLGILLASLAVYVAHLVQRGLDTVEAVKEIVPYPLYGTVPLVTEGDPTTRMDLDSIWSATHGAASEAFRALCVSVSLSPAAPQGRGRCLQLTSGQPGEGKSTVAANLAVSLATSGGRVILVDMDLRKPMQHRFWKVARTPGYCDFVGQGLSAGQLQQMTVARRVGDATIDVLPAGTRLPDTLGAVMSRGLKDLVEHLSQRYDYVLIDSPPAFVAETSVIAQHADLILLVSRPGVVERGNLRQAVELLARVPAAKGAVFNAVAREHTEYYYYGGRHYNYYYYGGRYDTEDRRGKRAAS
jgi:capsular exopolysaccharide synthesis family protein